MSDLVDLMSSARFFEMLPRPDLEAIAERMRPVSFTARQSLFLRGDAGGHLYLVLSGRIRMSIVSSEGRELSLLLAERGHMFGEIALFDGGPRTCDATAIVKAEAMSLDRAAFQELIAAHPSIAAAAISFACARLRETNKRLEAIAIHSIEVRLARHLFGLLPAEQQELENLVDELATPLDFNISQGELGLLLGASRPKVNLALKTLEEETVIERTDDGLICNPSLLWEVCCFDDV